MKEIALLIILEVLLIVVCAVIGPAFYQYMLCGMAILPFLFLALGILKSL